MVIAYLISSSTGTSVAAKRMRNSGMSHNLYNLLPINSSLNSFTQIMLQMISKSEMNYPDNYPTKTCNSRKNVAMFHAGHQQ